MIEEFVEKVERFLRYVNRIKNGELGYIKNAARLAEHLGFGTKQLDEAIKAGARKRFQRYLRQIRSGENIETYTKHAEQLLREFEIEDGRELLAQALKEGELRRLAHYILLLYHGENIHLAEKIRHLARKYNLEGEELESVIQAGERKFLLRNIKQIKEGPLAHPLLPQEEEILRKLARKYGYEDELDEAIKEWRRKAG